MAHLTTRPPECKGPKVHRPETLRIAQRTSSLACDPIISPGEEFSYRFVQSRPLPTIDLSKTFLSRLLSVRWYTRLVMLLRDQYWALAHLYRLGGAIFMLLFVVSRKTGASFGIIALLCSPAVFLTLGLLSTDMIWLLYHQHDCWVYTVMNLTTSVMFGISLNDHRAWGIPSWFAGLQACILIDANFLTMKTVVRSIVLGAPFAALAGIMVGFNLTGTMRKDIALLQFTDSFVIHLDDLFVNWSFTLSVFLGHELYNKYTFMSKSDKIIRCVMLRCPLKLEKTVTGSISPANKIYEVVHCTKVSTHRRVSNMAATSLVQYTQDLFLVPPSRKSLDPWRTVLPSLTPRKQLHRLQLVLLYGCGFVGFTLTSLCMLLVPWYNQDHWSTARQTTDDDGYFVAMACVAFTCTVVFCGTFAVCYQRDLLVRLATSFNVLFPSFHLLTSTICMKIIAQWEPFACATVMAWCLWFHFVLLLDALTPVVKCHLRWAKKYASVIVVLELICLVRLVLAILFSRDEAFANYTWSVGRLSMTAKSFLFSRVFMICLWNVRLVWRCALQQEDELISIQGLVEYVTKQQMFATSAQRTTKHRGAAVWAVVAVTPSQRSQHSGRQSMTNATTG